MNINILRYSLFGIVDQEVYHILFNAGLHFNDLQLETQKAFLRLGGKRMLRSKENQFL